MDGVDTRLGWAVLPDGTQVGVLSQGGSRARRLRSRTSTLNGTTYGAEPITP